MAQSQAREALGEVAELKLSRGDGAQVTLQRSADGWQVLERLRKKKQTPVLMLTARDKIEDRVRGLQDGADDYLVKPFSPAVLVQTVQRLLAARAPQSAR